mmetsp:Transcript_9233/g.25560  ORF Transcript_9233/g.25560 Transcript_9233/m.25560 type:complete len:94 (+) Transcript_9233:1713-1994(+)
MVEATRKDRTTLPRMRHSAVICGRSTTQDPHPEVNQAQIMGRSQHTTTTASAPQRSPKNNHTTIATSNRLILKKSLPDPETALSDDLRLCPNS